MNNAPGGPKPSGDRRTLGVNPAHWLPPCHIRVNCPVQPSLTARANSIVMPEKKTTERARQDEMEGKAPSTEAGEFVREEIEHIRQGKHGARSTRQAIAIGLSKARRAGVKLPLPSKGTVSQETRQKAERDAERAQHGRRKPTSRKRSRATTRALRRESHAAASTTALSKQARSAAHRRSRTSKSQAARKAARTRAKNS